MHGRVKVRTTEEQKEIVKREKLKKAEAFKETMVAILEKRSSGVHDQEGLNLTANLLVQNPDVITLWNYRREIFLQMKKDCELENYQKLLEKDLGLTEQCLRVNPKSYGSWHHRVWILDNLPQPDWKAELKLCTRYLELDERNFHCWDYRKTVAERSKVPDISEYQFTLEKIEANFSNYSAWHLRSKLLPKIFPDQDKKLPINEAKHKEELELVENAAFTDPNDQSGWFYLRWLLGLKEPKTSFLYIEGGHDIIAVTSKNVSVTNSDEASTFESQIDIKINGEAGKGSWSSGSGQSRSCLWKFKPNSKIESEDSITLILKENGLEHERQTIRLGDCVKIPANFIPKFSESLLEVIMNQLSSCNQLIELEPDSKWTLLTRIFLMICIDKWKYEKDIKSGLEKLKEIDPLRKGYYSDLRGRVTVQMAIMKEEGKKSFVLTGQNLAWIYHPQCFHSFEEIDLSQNELSSESLNQFYTLVNCKRLNLSDNKIKNLLHFPVLPNLEILLIENNLIEEIDLERFKKFPQLKHVGLSGNPIVEKMQSILDLTNDLGKIKFDYLES